MFAIYSTEYTAGGKERKHNISLVDIDCGCQYWIYKLGFKLLFAHEISAFVNTKIMSGIAIPHFIILIRNQYCTYDFKFYSVLFEFCNRYGKYFILMNDSNIIWFWMSFIDLLTHSNIQNCYIDCRNDGSLCPCILLELWIKSDIGEPYDFLAMKILKHNIGIK